MGSRQDSGEVGQRQGRPSKDLRAQTLPIREIPVSGEIPRFEIPGWGERYGVVAGITARGPASGRGFDLGLWSDAPVGEVMSRWLAFRREMSQFEAIVLGNQVHGADLMNIDAGRGWIHIDRIDGWLTSTPGILLTVTVADCIPLYLVVPGRGVALLHAGWRGTSKGILARGVERLAAATKCSPEEIVMHSGVGICGDCYEVGSEVLLGSGLPAAGPGPWHLDLSEQLAAQALEVGVTSFTRSAWCSAHDRPAFYSHRASRGSDGRMVAYIGMAPG